MIAQVKAKCCESRRESRGGIPAREECRSLWSRFGLSEEVVAHSETVAELARILAIHLNRAGLHLDVGLVTAAGLLHDLGRGGSDRSRVSAGLLLQLGYPDVAKVVAVHIRNGNRNSRTVDEADLVHLADRLLRGDRPMPLDEQAELVSDLYSSQPASLDAVCLHLKEARRIQEQVEALLGCPLNAIVQRHRRGLQAASVRAPREVVLVRAGAIRTSGICGREDAPMSPEGMRQAEALCEELQGMRFSAIYCSDWRSAADTARIVADPHHLNPRGRQDLGELRLGKWEGLAPDEISRRYPREVRAMRLDPLCFCYPGGESYMDCALRVIPAFLEIQHSCRGNILVVGHEAVNRIILCQVTGLPMERLFDFEQDCGCWNIIGVKDDAYELKNVNRLPGRGGTTTDSAGAAEFLAGLGKPGQAAMPSEPGCPSPRE